MGGTSKQDKSTYLKHYSSLQSEVESQSLGETSKRHEDVLGWMKDFKVGTLMGNKNDQDFAVDLCTFLEVDTSQLPWRQGREKALNIAKVAGAIVMPVPALAAYGI